MIFLELVLPFSMVFHDFPIFFPFKPPFFIPPPAPRGLLQKGRRLGARGGGARGARRGVFLGRRKGLFFRHENHMF